VIVVMAMQRRRAQRSGNIAVRAAVELRMSKSCVRLAVWSCRFL
jgi:hypothetical protein